MNSNSRYVLWGLAVLLAVAIAPLPYGYYTFLRISAFIGFAYLASHMFLRNKVVLAVSFIALLILFNPVFPIYLSKNLWMLIDGATALFLIGISLKKTI